LVILKQWSKTKQCQLFYYDESGFCASPPVQRSWSLRGKPHESCPAAHQRVNVMGVLDYAKGKLYHQQTDKAVNRQCFVDFMETLIPQIATDVPSFIVLDNASIHHGLDQAMLDKWIIQYKTVLVYLPAYSPELNLIEIVWKHAKYHWREFVTWSKDTLAQKVTELLDGFGTKFTIGFK
jgi:transposase